MILSLLCLINVNAQEVEKKDEFKPHGKAFGKVFFNYHYNATEGENPKNVFELQRSYLGYGYSFSEAISTKITLDVGQNDAGSAYTAYLKTAQLDWKMTDQVKVTLGLMGLKQFDTQEKFWGYRYVYKSMQDEFGFGSSADLGINGEFKLSDMIKVNLFLLNGEGYKKLQDDMGTLKVGGNVVFEPVEGLILKGYYDIYTGNIAVEDPATGNEVATDTTSIKSLAFFAGYKTEKFRIGAEFNKQIDGKKYASQAADHDLTGISVYGTYVINKKFEVFANYMKLSSNELKGQTEGWNYNKDGNLILGGVQYAPVKGVSVSLNYRTFKHDNSDINDYSAIYVNFQYKF